MRVNIALSTAAVAVPRRKVADHEGGRRDKEKRGILDKLFQIRMVWTLLIWHSN